MARRTLLFALVLMVVRTSLNGAPFSLVTTNSFVAVRNGGMAWGDYDNDGFLDLIVTGDDGNGVTALYHNNGTGGFVRTSMKFPGFRSSYAFWVDVDNDGYLDLVLSGIIVSKTYNGYGSRIYKNVNGTGFVESWGLDAESLIVAFGDVNNDGLQDFLLRNTPGMDVMVNQGGTNFVGFPAPTRPMFGTGQALGDIDGDGYLDLIQSGQAVIPNFGAFLLRNDRGQRFVDAGPVGPDGEVRLFDLDNDGRLDLWLSSHVSGGTYLWRNNGGPIDPQFALKQIGLYDGLAVGDYDNDGLMDVISAPEEVNAQGELLYNVNRLFHNDGSNHWGIVTSGFLTGRETYNIYFGDYDNDGDLDVVMNGQRTGGGGYAVHLYRNNASVSNIPPTRPFFLEAEPLADAMKLKWRAAFDAEQQGGLTYNVRVGTTPGGSDIVNPQSAADGWRRVVRQGNSGLNEFFILRGLEIGRRYYWSVQAIDNSYAGGRFAPEESFVALVPPVIEPITPITLLEDSPETNVAITVSSPVTSASNLLVFAECSNPDLFPTGSFRMSGDATNRLLTLRPARDQNGTATFKVTAADSTGAEYSVSFNVNVLAVNDPPAFTLLTNSDTVNEDSGARVVENAAININVGPADESGQMWRFEVIADRPDLFSGQPTISANGTLTYTPAPDANGDSLVHATLVDDGGTALGGQNRSVAQTLTISILPTADLITPLFNVAGPVLFPRQLQPFAIARCDGRARVWLDASPTKNPDDLPAFYDWSVNGSRGATGRVTSVALALGTNDVSLTIFGAPLMARQQIIVVSPQFVTTELEKILLTAGLEPRDLFALLKILFSAEDAYSAVQCLAGAFQMQTFLDEILYGSYTADPIIWSELALGAQQIIDTTGQPPSEIRGGRIQSVTKTSQAVQLSIEPFLGAQSVIQRSVNLRDWEPVGALSASAGPANFQDRLDTSSSTAFYRLVVFP